MADKKPGTCKSALGVAALGVAGVEQSSPPDRAVSGGSPANASPRCPSTPATLASPSANPGLRKIAIRASSLSKMLGERRVLREIDLDVAVGESVALVGANGAGKTTLLRCLASILRPSTGEVLWFGRPATRDPAARRLVGMVAHETFLYPNLTLRENLIFAARMCDVRQPARRADALLRSAGLCLYAHRSPTRISQGMRQRVAVARALVHDPRILLLDEPFAGLDAAGTEWLLSLLVDLRDQGRTLCFAIHDKQMVRRLAHRVLRLSSGRLEERERSPAAGFAKHPTSARAA